LQNYYAVTVEGENIYVEGEFLDLFNEQLDRSIELEERYLETFGRYEQGQQSLLSQWDLTFSDIGVEQP
jgi:hypothetical protein